MGSTRHFFTRSALLSTTILCSLAVETVHPGEIMFRDVSDSAGFTKVTTSYGGAWGDVNSDGWPDLFANNHARRNSIYLNNSGLDFTDVTLQIDALGFWAGTGAWEDTHGGSWADYDNDGDQDLLISTGDCCDPQFFENEDGSLFYRTIEKGFGDDVDKGGRMPIWFDAEDDGLLETVIMSFYPAPLMQQVGGVFSQLPWSTLQCKDNQYGVMLDSNGDGHLDLICVHKGDIFAGQAFDLSSLPFPDISADFPAIDGVNDVIIGDFDNNLRSDLLLLRGALRPSQVKVFEGNKLEAQLIDVDRGFSFKSAGPITVNMDWNKTFDNFTNIWIGAEGNHPLSEQNLVLDPADPAVQGVRLRTPQSYPEIYIGYDTATQTWHFDLYTSVWTYLYIDIESTAAITDLEAHGIRAIDGPIRPVLLSNLPGGYQDITATSGLNIPISCVGGTSGDFDNDMDRDIYLVCRGGVENIENRMYRNNGDGTFSLLADEGGARSVTGSAVFEHNGTGEGVVMADYDVDGLLDLFVMNGLNMRPHGRNGGPDQMFRNIGEPRQWIELDLVGTISNRDGLGAKVYATAGGVTQLREQNGSYHRWSQDHQRIHFGLGDNNTVDLEVRWPSGSTQFFDGVEANQLYRVTENTGIQPFVPEAGGGIGAECFEPTYSSATEKGVFVWSACDGTGRWYVRATSGGSSTIVRYEASITSSPGFTTLQPFSFESGDSIVIAPDSTRADIVMLMINAGQDGVDMIVDDAAETCFDLAVAPPGTDVMLGSKRKSVSVPIDLHDQTACTMVDPPPTAGDCGPPVPAFDGASDDAIVVWRDCDSDRFHLRAGAASWTRYLGNVTSTGTLSDVVAIAVELDDIVELTNDNTIDFSLGLKQPFFDGFDFTGSCGDTLTLDVALPGKATIVVGADRTPATSPIVLSSLPFCDQN